MNNTRNKPNIHKPFHFTTLDRFYEPTDRECTHLDQIRDVTPSADGCEECLKMGDTWVHLRICLICGHVGCCDSSKNKHATRHAHKTHHPLIQSFQPDEVWLWCYEDQLTMIPK